MFNQKIKIVFVFEKKKTCRFHALFQRFLNIFFKFKI